MGDSNAVKALLGINIGFGLLFALAPKLGMRIFGIDPARNPNAAYVTRYFGARLLLLAALLGSEDSRDVLLRRLPMLAATDGAVNLIAAITGEVPKRTVLMGALTSATAVALGMSVEQ